MSTARPSRNAPRSAAIILVVLAVIGVAAGVLLDRARGPKWTASTNVLVQVSPASVNSLLLTGQAAAVTPEDVADAAAMAVSQNVLTKAAQKLAAGSSWTELAGRVSAAAVPSTHLVSVTATAPTEADALRVSKLVASTLVDVEQQQVDFATANLPAVPATGTSGDVQRRALLTKTLTPLQAFSTTQPQQVSPSMQTPIALGIVGLAAGALVIVLLTLLRPSIRRSRDIQMLVNLPAVDFRGTDGGPEVSRLVSEFLGQRFRGTLLICPVDVYAEDKALMVAEWIRSTGEVAGARVVPMVESGSGSGLRLKPADQAPRVQVLGTPVVMVAGNSTPPADSTALLMVVPQGTRRQVVVDSVALMRNWRPINAVVVTL